MAFDTGWLLLSHCKNWHVIKHNIIYLDFQAFDSVSHNELLYMLWKIGITGSGLSHT